MKKASGFEKFFKGKEKSGAAKKEEIRNDKRQVRKEREEEIAARKRQKRAQKKEGFSSQPQRFKTDRTVPAFQKREDEQRGKPSFKVEKRRDSNETYKNKTGKPKQDGKSRPPFYKKDEKGNRHNSNKGDHNGQRPARPGERKLYDNREKRRQTFGPKEGPARQPRMAQAESPRTTHPTIVKKHTPTPKIGAGLGPATGKPASNPPAATDQMPLNKFIAHSGVCSRRDAVDLIKAGKVKVNGTLVLEPGHKVALTDDVSVTGKHLKPVKDFIYILLNKPKDYITTTEDPQERKTVLDLLQGAPQTRIYPVGRLDRNTSGVLLLTNDGDLSQKLTHPSNEIKKVYAVTLDKPLTKNHFEDILRGVELEDGPATVDVLAYTDAKDHTQLGVELHSGRNRIVRRVFEHFGYDVKALDRVVFAGLTKKNVNRGKWRFLTEREVRDLKFFKRGR